LGKLDQIIYPETGWTLAEESKGEPVDIKNWYNRQYLIDINCYILNGKLNVAASYDDQVISKDKMQNLLDYFKISLIEIIDKVSKSKGKEINVTDSYKDTLLEIHQIESILHKYDDVEDIYPVSNMQVSILAHNIFSSNNGNDVQNLVFNIDGNINLEFFSKAIEETMNNNSLLRTSFVWRRVSYPHQIVHKHVDPDIKIFDLINYPQSEKDMEIKKIIDSEKHTSFKIDQAPLMRFRIVRCDEKRFVLIWSSFTSLVDNWSYNIIAREIFNNYKMLLHGKKTLAQAKHPFKNYIQWIQKKDKNDAKKFWINQLKNCKSIIAEEARNPFGKDLNDKFELVESYRSISSEDNKRLKEYVSRNNCTIFNLLECLWGIVIAKHYNTKTAVFGVLTTGRIPDIKGIETMVGMFVNILPVSVVSDENLTLTEMMKMVQINQIDILKNSYLSIDDIAECNNINVKELNSIVHDKTIVFVSDVNEDWDKDMIDDIKIDYEKNTIAINVPFRLYVVPGEELILDIKYNKYACDSEIINSLLDGLQYLLKCVIINSSIKIDELYSCCTHFFDTVY
jgi:non-ribosomal peptide synthase protein (TIGR01720 family)